MSGIGTKCVMMTTLLVSIYLLKVNNRNTRARCEICSKLAIKTHENMKASVNFLTLNVPIPDKVKNLRFYEGLKPFEAPQRSVKIKI